MKDWYELSLVQSSYQAFQGPSCWTKLNSFFLCRPEGSLNNLPCRSHCTVLKEQSFYSSLKKSTDIKSIVGLIFCCKRLISWGYFENCYLMKILQLWVCIYFFEDFREYLFYFHNDSPWGFTTIKVRSVECVGEIKTWIYLFLRLLILKLFEIYQDLGNKQDFLSNLNSWYS